MLIAAAAALAGCVTTPASQLALMNAPAGDVLRAADKDYKAMNYDSAMLGFENVQMREPKRLTNTGGAKYLDDYFDCQIQWGLRQARAAEAQGDLHKAYIFFTLVSRVYPETDLCRKTAEDAVRVKKTMAKGYLVKAQNALAGGLTIEAANCACQSLWLGGGDEAQKVFDDATRGQGGGAPLPWQTSLVREVDLDATVRTDTMARLEKQPVFAPYGVPIYNGQPPRYYISMGKVTVNGFPRSMFGLPNVQNQPDGINLLSTTAKQNGADAVINVQLWTKRKRYKTSGELVRFADLPAEQAAPKP
jgi:hypothetical protein